MMTKVQFYRRVTLTVFCLIWLPSLTFLQTVADADEAGVRLPLNDICHFWDRRAIYFMGHCYNLLWAENYDKAAAVCSESHSGAKLAATDSEEKIDFLSYFKSVQSEWDPSWDEAFIGASFTGSWTWGSDHYDDSVLSGLPAPIDATTDRIGIKFESSELVVKDGQEASAVLCQLEIVNMCPFEDSHLFYGSCYRIVHSDRSFDNATSACEEDGGHLAELTEASEQSLIKDLYSLYGDSGPMYVGARGSHADADGVYFRWLETADKFYRLPLSSVPSNDQLAGMCLTIDNGAFYYQTCGDEAIFLCEIELDIVKYVAVLPRLFEEYETEDNLLYVTALDETLDHDRPVVWAYVADSGAGSVVKSHTISKDAANKWATFDMRPASEIFLTSGHHRATVVITTLSNVTVQFFYEGEGLSNTPLYSSSLLHPVSDYSSNYFIVTSTAACDALPLTRGTTDANPLQAKPETCSCETFVAVVAVDDDANTDDGHTSVTIRFPNSGAGITYVKDGDYIVKNPSELTIPLSLYEVAFFRTSSDLSGTFISSNERLTVMSGYVTKGGLNCQESMSYTQVKPVGEAGTQFLTPPTPRDPDVAEMDDNDRYRVVALKNSTTIKINRAHTNLKEKTIFLQNEGDVREFALQNEVSFLISSNVPFMVYKLSILSSVESLVPLLVKYRTFRELKFLVTDLGSSSQHYKLMVFGGENELADTSASMSDPSTNIGPLVDVSPTVFRADDWQIWTVPLTSHLATVRIHRDGFDSAGVTALWYDSDKTSGFMSECGSFADEYYRKEIEAQLDYIGNSSFEFEGLSSHVVYFGFDEEENDDITTQSVTETSTNGCTLTCITGDDESSPTVTETIVTTQVPETFTCQPPKEYNLSTEQKDQMAEEVKEELKIDTKSTGAYTRTKESAKDDRPSSQAVGMFGVAMISLTFTLLVLPDVFSAAKWFLKKPKG